MVGTHTILGLGGFGAVLFALERAVPLRRSRTSLPRRLVVNVAMAALALVATIATVQPAVSRTFEWAADTGIGLLRFWKVHPLGHAVVTFLLMDLLFYYWHQLNHRVPLLWRLHNVHHIDPDLDVTTAFRFHFGEIVLSAAFRVVQVAVIGPSMWSYLAYEIIFQANTLFHHSNVRLPIRLERLLNRVFVTPRMHGIHHSQVPGENRANYGVVFPWWDWIHRTLEVNVPQSQVAIGIAAYSAPEDNRVWPALAMPFRRQRDYWTYPDGAPAERDNAVLKPDRLRLAE